jgi:hypothetical protein
VEKVEWSKEVYKMDYKHTGVRVVETDLEVKGKRKYL